jgi:endonuclease/exonuclease/phosphatase family metal-dependent hydrolase
MLTPLRSLLLTGCALLATTLSVSGDARYGQYPLPASMAAADDPSLSVMTYNVNGLPWPVAFGREAALERIGARLAEMRGAARQPRLVLLQEAFRDDAAAIAQRAGYAHVAYGPDAAFRSAAEPTAADRRFRKDARWDRGELAPKQLGSGLMVLSDYPITAVDRMAFPDFACAGFDCLANKGVLLVRIAVPGMTEPLTVANAHLNARKAAGVPTTRSYQAYERQVGLMAGFIERRVSRGAPLLLGGDMNIGRDKDRARAFFAAFARSGLTFVTPADGGLRRALSAAARTDAGTRADLLQADHHGKDWLFARAGGGQPMKIRSARVPFGSEGGGEPLSDHVGYVIDYATPRSL